MAAETSRLPRRLSGAEPKGAQLRDILEGLVEALGSGAPLPSERELAERYEVARMTVRTEIDRLVAGGRAYRVQGRGTFVAAARVAQASAFSSFSEDMRGRGMEPSSRVLEQEVVDAGDALAAALRVPVGAPLLAVGRLRLADGEPMALERVSLALDRHPQAQHADFGADASLFTLLADWGSELVSADQRVLAVAVKGEDARRLDVAPESPGLRFETLAHDATGAPVFHAWSLFRGDRYEIAMRQERTEGGESA